MKIKNIFLFGGGSLISEFYLYLQSLNKFQIYLITSKRHLNSKIDGVLFSDLLKKNKIKYYKIDKLDLKKIKNIENNFRDIIGISFGAAWIFNNEIINAFNNNLFNVHGTRLPKNKGGGGFSWQILMNNSYGFSLIHRINPKLDNGMILDYCEFIFDKCITPIEFQKYFDEKTLIFLKKFINKLIKNQKLININQPHYLSTYWPRLDDQVHGWINWEWSGYDLIKFINAFDSPYCGAHTYYKSKIIYLKNCILDEGDGKFHPFQSGLIYRINEKYIAICSTNGSLIIRNIYNSRGKEIPLNSFEVGERFFTPALKLENALKTRAYYDFNGLKK